MSPVTLTIEDKIAIVTIDNPPQNRIDTEFMAQLSDAIDRITASGVRAAVLNARGDNFCFGGDIKPWPDLSVSELRAQFQRWLADFNRFERLPIPTIAAVRGICFGGGFELALRCDMIVAGSSSTFAHTEQTVGITTLMGGVYRVAERAGRGFAAKLAFTSTPVSAAELQQRGIVTDVVPDAEVETFAVELATRLANGPTRAHAAHKAMLRLWASGGVQAADEAVIDLSMAVFETHDAKIGLATAINTMNRG